MLADHRDGLSSLSILAWSSIAQSVCQRAFSLLAIWCLGPRVQILHSAFNLSPFDLNIACLCQSIEINNNKYVCMYDVCMYVYIYIYMCVCMCISVVFMFMHRHALYISILKRDSPCNRRRIRRVSSPVIIMAWWMSCHQPFLSKWQPSDSTH